MMIEGNQNIDLSFVQLDSPHKVLWLVESFLPGQVGFEEPRLSGVVQVEVGLRVKDLVGLNHVVHLYKVHDHPSETLHLKDEVLAVEILDRQQELHQLHRFVLTEVRVLYDVEEGLDAVDVATSWAEHVVLPFVVVLEQELDQFVHSLQLITEIGLFEEEAQGTPVL